MRRAGFLFFTLLAIAMLAVAKTSAASAAGGVLSGKVVDAGTGAPLNAASISVKGTALRASSDGDGAFVISDVPTGVAKLEIERAGYKHRELSVSVTPGDPTLWTIALFKTKH